ncbi:MAG: Cysteine-rich secretory protein family protein [Verrucomicrobia bacterium ADurb.Bin118]|nr:MAG: Cysteine-rich secretory protein family protein [Verrucomicrobia bacterium ADurb.Bin118]
MKPNISSCGVLLLCVLIGGQPMPVAAQTQYTGDGVPAGVEEAIRWHANRGRFDTASENQLRGTDYTDVVATAGPLAPNHYLTLAARHHSEDMARNNVFQHETVPGSTYYDPVTQPEPWDRLTAEGYVWNQAAENIAADYPDAEAVYVGWWKSEGHRLNMCDASLREIGNGYFYWAASNYRRYYTMDLGRSGANYFFTDTLFHDANGNGIYNETEAVAGVALYLLVEGVPINDYDISSAVGSFAVPIGNIAPATTVQVVISNTTTTALSLTIPLDYWTNRELTLAPGESRGYGMFTTGATGADRRNVGLRNLMPLPPLSAPRLDLARVGGGLQLSWPSETGWQYQPQWTTDFQNWNDLTPLPLKGTGHTLIHLDAAADGFDARFYRLFITPQ